MKHGLLLSLIFVAVAQPLSAQPVSAQDPIEVQQVVDVRTPMPVTNPQPQLQLQREMLLDLRPNPTFQVVGMIIGGVLLVGGVGLMISGARDNTNFSPSPRGLALAPPGFGALLGGGTTAALGFLMLLPAAIHFAVKRKRMRAIDQEIRRLNFRGGLHGFELTF